MEKKLQFLRIAFQNLKEFNNFTMISSNVQSLKPENGSQVEPETNTPLHAPTPLKKTQSANISKPFNPKFVIMLGLRNDFSN